MKGLVTFVGVLLQECLDRCLRCKTKRKTDERGVSDLLDAPGIVKEHRDAGLQKFLALAAMNWLREIGTYPITLEYWGDDENILYLYRDLGFELVQQQITYRKELQ